MDILSVWEKMCILWRIFSSSWNSNAITFSFHSVLLCTVFLFFFVCFHFITTTAITKNTSFLNTHLMHVGMMKQNLRFVVRIQFVEWTQCTVHSCMEHERNMIFYQRYFAMLLPHHCTSIVLKNVYLTPHFDSMHLKAKCEYETNFSNVFLVS